MASEIASLEAERNRQRGYIPFSFGDRIRQARRHPLEGPRRNQMEMAEEVGVTVGQLSSWEAGTLSPVSP